MSAFEIPTIQTERLTLRAPRLDDFETYAAFGTTERTAGIGGPFDRSAAFNKLCAIAGHWILRGFGRWLVADRETDEALGIVGLFHPDDWPEPEIAWTVFAAAEGRGIAHEAACASRAYAYETLGWSRLVSLTLPDNSRSIALAKRMGASYEGDFVHPEFGPLNVWRHLPPEECAP